MTERIEKYNKVCRENNMRGDCILPMECLNRLAQDYTTLEILSMIDFEGFEEDDKYITGVYNECITSIADDADADFYIDNMCEGYPCIAEGMGEIA